MSAGFFVLNDPAGQVRMPQDGILSRSLFGDDHIKLEIFALDAGQELSEHTSSMPAMLTFVSGDADLALGGEIVKATTGSVVYMEPNLPHSLVARTPVVMLLTLVKTTKDQ